MADPIRVTSLQAFDELFGREDPLRAVVADWFMNWSNGRPLVLDLDDEQAVESALRVVGVERVEAEIVEGVATFRGIDPDGIVGPIRLDLAGADLRPNGSDPCDENSANRSQRPKREPPAS